MLKMCSPLRGVGGVNAPRGLPAGICACPYASALLSPTRGDWGVGSVAGIILCCYLSLMILTASNRIRLVSADCFVPQMSMVLIDWVASNTPTMFQLFAGSTP